LARNQGLKGKEKLEAETVTKKCHGTIPLVYLESPLFVKAVGGKYPLSSSRR
jgi:hypothetical protein